MEVIGKTQTHVYYRQKSQTAQQLSVRKYSNCKKRIISPPEFGWRRTKHYQKGSELMRRPVWKRNTPPAAMVRSISSCSIIHACSPALVATLAKAVEWVHWHYGSPIRKGNYGCPIGKGNACKILPPACKRKSKSFHETTNPNLPQCGAPEPIKKSSSQSLQIFFTFALQQQQTYERFWRYLDLVLDF